MQFIKAFKTATVKSKRRSGVKAYYSGGQVQFSRLFGYQRVVDRYEPIPQYLDAIEAIFHMLGDGKTIIEIKHVLDSHGWRDSSKNLFSPSRIIGIAERPVYAGFLQQGLRLRKVENLTPIITLDLWRKAQRQVRIEKKKMLGLY